jgi:hypothetical protein
LPKLIIILFLLSVSSLTYIDKFPNEILSAYFWTSFSFVIAFEFTLTESQNWPLNEEKINIFSYTYIYNS